MERVVIDNPIINSPYKEPSKHFYFDEGNITNKIIDSRRKSSYFVPIPPSRKEDSGPQMSFDEDAIFLTQIETEYKFINEIREKVNKWRSGDYQGCSRTTYRLLKYWTNPNRENKLFFCQLEAIETLVYIFEVAKRYEDTAIEEKLIYEQGILNSNLYRLAFKMATGTGKTVVMAMVIVWQTLNKITNIHDNRFSKSFLIVTPGITIRDRLRVLHPNEKDNYYNERDLVPPYWEKDILKATIKIINYHSLALKDTSDGSRLSKIISGQVKSGASKEQPAEMVERITKGLGKNFIVINDEAHHCYPVKSQEIEKETSQDIEQQNESAKIWLNGLQLINSIKGVKAVVDLSATPFFLKGSGFPEGKLFPWVVTDFALIDAIESGLVKIPRVPVNDNSLTSNQPTYRDLWVNIREDLPKKNRNVTTSEPKLPIELEGAIQSLYANYLIYHREWEKSDTELPPPVFIIVCNNTTVSRLVYNYIAGWEKEIAGEKFAVSGQLPLFNNVVDNDWGSYPNSILIDSEQISSGLFINNDFKKKMKFQLEDFKREYKNRFPGRDILKITDEDITREVMNTIGKSNKLGENIKCVVSVSMLTEGWDASNVTHILGVRAFQSQLLCEQVVGRALRRQSYIVGDDGKFEAEYAEVYGVPFSFIPANGEIKKPPVLKPKTRVKSLNERKDLFIKFPKVVGYKYAIAGTDIKYIFSPNTELVLSTANIPTLTENSPIVGVSSIHNLNDLKNIRIQSIEYALTKNLIFKYFEEESESKPWLFPKLLLVVREWVSNCLLCNEGTFKQLLLLAELNNKAVDKIYHSIIATNENNKEILPLLKPYDSVGITDHIDFFTTKSTYITNPMKSPISHVVADTKSWEQKIAQNLESYEEVYSYVKNHNLDFTIPYSINGIQKKYIPDFLIRWKKGEKIINIVLEVSGFPKEDKAIKVSTTINMWIPAINNYKKFGEWFFVEITNPWGNVHEEILKALEGPKEEKSEEY